MLGGRRLEGTASADGGSADFGSPADGAVLALPDIRVEPDTFTVRIDGEVIEEAPAAELPMAQRYFLF